MNLKILVVCLFLVIHKSTAGDGHYYHHDDYEDHNNDGLSLQIRKFENSTLHLLHNVERFAIRTEVTMQSLLETTVHGQKHVEIAAAAEDCADIQEKNYKSDVYYIQPLGAPRSYCAYCDLEFLGGGWMVIQKRVDGHIDFYRGFDEYIQGFGDRTGEYWVGLEALHEITSRRKYELFVELEDFEGQKKYASYQTFSVGPEHDGYPLTVGNYSGDAGDSLSEHNGMKFSTFDVDNDENDKNCAKMLKGSWWFKNCMASNLNGRYLPAETKYPGKGIIWNSWRGEEYSLKSARMLIRRIYNIELDVKSSANATVDILGGRFDMVDDAIKQINLEAADRRFDILDSSLLTSFQAIDSRFDSLNTSMVQALQAYDRRFDTLDASYGQLNLNAYDRRFDTIDASLSQAQLNFEAFDKRFDELEAKVATIDLKPLDERITKVEITQVETLKQLTVLTEKVHANTELLKEVLSKLGHLQVKEAPIKEEYPEDCEYVEGGLSGIYKIQPPGVAEPFNVYCDFHFQENRWTVIQNRFNGKVDFFRGYKEYQHGFGDFLGEFWLGLDKIYQITKNGYYDLYIEMCDFDDNVRYAKYSKFSVCSVLDGYRLNIDGYSGDAGDSLSEHAGHQFSTYDHDVDLDAGNCAKDHYGAWWYTSCLTSNLNGKYSTGQVPHATGMVWKEWHGYDYPLKSTKMFIRKKVPVNPVHIHINQRFKPEEH